ncbi:MAG: hypothetical protein AB1505_17005 [Candidatus Latescibacterota bacterium]
MSKLPMANALPLIALVTAAGLCACALSVAPTSSQERALTLELAAFPSRVAVEDSTATAEVWATLRQGERPAKDSTVVAFATTVGRITASSYTKDGLAVAILRSPGDGRPRRAEVVAQALTVRDTLDVDFVLTGE